MARLFDDDDPQTVDAIIRHFFKGRGGNMPAPELAKALIAEQVLPPGVVDRAALRGVTAMCRRALSADTPERIPFAQPIGSGKNARWIQLDLFTHRQAVALIKRRSRDVHDDYEKLRRLQTWCLERFGMAPEIPELIMPSTELDDPSDDSTQEAGYDDEDA
jgi:hypothetical protein